MASGWAAAAIAGAVAAASFLRMIWLDGRRNGMLDANLVELRKIAGNHEDRLRAIELGHQAHGGGGRARR